MCLRKSNERGRGESGRSKKGETGVKHVSHNVNQATHGRSNIQLHVMGWDKQTTNLELRRQLISIGGLGGGSRPAFHARACRV
jgi:hypothetical protein